TRAPGPVRTRARPRRRPGRRQEDTSGMTGFGAITSRVYALFTRDPRPTRVVVDLAELTAGDRVLDVGCGAGAGVRRAAARVGEGSVAAVDPSPTFVSMVRRRVPGADVRLGGAE